MKLKELENVRILTDKINKDYQNDLASADLTIDPRIDNIEKYIKYHIYQLQNPTPNVALAFSILRNQNYEFLPVCLNAVDMKNIYQKTIIYCDKNIVFLNLKLLKVGFWDFYERNSGKIIFESKIGKLTFGVFCYESENSNVFWKLVDLEFFEEENFQDDFKSEIIYIVNNFINCIIFSRNKRFFELLETYLLYFTIYILKYLILLEFVKKLKQNRNFELSFKVNELAENENVTLVILLIAGLTIFTQMKVTFRLFNIFNLETLDSKSIDWMISDFCSSKSIFEVQFSTNRNLLKFSGEFTDKLNQIGVNEASNPADVVCFKTFKANVSLSNSQQALIRIREQCWLSVFASLVEKLSGLDFLRDHVIRFYGVVFQQESENQLQKNGRRISELEELVLRSTLRKKEGINARIALEKGCEKVLVFFDEQLLLEDWNFKLRVKCFTVDEGRVVPAESEIKELLIAAFENK